MYTLTIRMTAFRHHRVLYFQNRMTVQNNHLTLLKSCKRIRDATLHTFIYHYIFAAKSKFLII